MMSLGPWPRVGVVIPVYNAWPCLQLCLQALAKQTYPRDRFQVRVVDNGSSDWPQQPVFPLALEVIRHRHPGSYGARNCGAQHWDVELLAFTDADCEPDPTWLAEGVRALRTAGQPAPLLAGRIRLVLQQPQHPTTAELLDQLLGFDQERTVRRAGYGATANLWISQTAFAALAGFRDHTRSGADRDLCERARFAGIPLEYCAAAVVSHPARHWPEMVNKQRRIVGGRLSLAGPSPVARLNVLLLSLRPIASESWRVLRSRSLALPLRVRLLVLVVRLRWAVVLEWLRLQHPAHHPLR